jgi:hypothetical protein
MAMNQHWLLFLTLGRVKETDRTWSQMLSRERWGPCMDHVKAAWFDNGSDREDFVELNYLSRLYGGHDALFFEDTNKGIAVAINEMMHYAFKERGAQFVTTMGSDIIEPPMFVDIRETVFRMHPEIGICATPPQNDKPTYAYDDHLQMDICQPIGNHTYSRQLWESIGYLREDYGIYGPLDLDYCDRAKAAGFLSVQITNWPSWHIGVNNDPDYEAAKQASLKISWPQYLEKRKAYARGEGIRYVPERFA